ncbi:MAG: cell division protein ZapB [Burkholderiales bacterium]|nr:cell division protein ZapB [Burkholderiales bacterium]
MEAELDSLDTKIAQLVQLCHRLRKDNTDLQQELAAAKSQNRELSDKIEAARARLEALLSRIPEDAK